MADLFDEIRHAVHDLLHGSATPEERRSTLTAMRDSMVRARASLEELRQGIVVTEQRLEVDRVDLVTVRRRRDLAAAIPDPETVRVAERFEAQLVERVSLFERKLETQREELSLSEREYEAMSAQYASAQQSGPLASSATPPDQVPGAGAAAGGRPDERRDQYEELRQDIDRLTRDRRRAEAEAFAEEQLAALKKRMGK
jgi:hypothetical protein